MNLTNNTQTQSAQTLFMSDLHLDASQPAIAALFIKLLEECDTSVSAIYILGDLFEAWIGDDDNTPFNHRIIQALKSTTERGLPIFFLHGNRDFLIGERFLQQSGCKLLPDETVINVYGTSVLLMHGDTLCTDDIAYLKVRKKCRNPWLQRFFLCLPLFVRKKIATKIRAKSKQHTSSMSPAIMDVTQHEVLRVMQNHNVAYLIHGHTHRPAIHEVTLGQTKAKRIVLGAWHERGSVYVWDQAGNQQLIS